MPRQPTVVGDPRELDPWTAQTSDVLERLASLMRASIAAEESGDLDAKASIDAEGRRLQAEATALCGAFPLKVVRS